MHFGTWLRDVRAEEREAGVNHRDLACRPAELTSYVQDQMCEALSRMERLYIRIPPAPLDESHLREKWEDFREPYIYELRKALDHIGAALTAVGCTEDELASIGRPEILSEETPEALEEGSENSESEPGTVQDATVVVPLREALATVGNEKEK